jgi:diphthamide synthase (EF-2-diphthine--ammonia ligase)
MRMNVGDINDVCDNFMVRATQGTGVELMRPLWGIERDRLKEELARQGYDIVVSCANIDKLGSLISNESVGKSYYDVYDKIKQIDGIDRAGEAGEFHGIECARIYQAFAIHRMSSNRRDWSTCIFKF